MRSSRRVGADLWLGFADAEPGWPLLAGSRLVIDRHASRRAERVAVAASGLAAGGYAASRSHTQGMGAAAVVPAGVRVGVDVVLIKRVSERHAAAILSGAEWEALAPVGALRPALAWGLKEAAAKGTGAPGQCFPFGVRIAQGPGGLEVRAMGIRFTAGWMQLGAMLFVWVRETATCLPWRMDG